MDCLLFSVLKVIIHLHRYAGLCWSSNKITYFKSISATFLNLIVSNMYSNLNLIYNKCILIVYEIYSIYKYSNMPSLFISCLEIYESKQHTFLFPYKADIPAMLWQFILKEVGRAIKRDRLEDKQVSYELLHCSINTG